MAWDPVWEDIYRSRPWGQYPGEDVIRFVAGNFYGAPDRSAVRLLEVGSGTGANLWFMAREGFCVHGIDGSETGVELSRQRLDRECPGWRSAGGQVLAGDMASLPYPDAFFDGALDVVAVCYSSFADARRIYAELARVVKPGGKLFLRTFERGCWGEGTGTLVDRNMWSCSEGHLAGFGPTRFTGEEELAELLPHWTIDRVEHSSLSEGGGRHHVRHLLVHGSRR
jgi:SAM-dependent methyltransferase